jgi:Mn-dependent DtxR family transcriptional regulator
MKAFTPGDWKISKAQQAILLSADADGLVIRNNSLAFRRLCDMGFVEYHDNTVRLTDRGKTMVNYLS